MSNRNYTATISVDQSPKEAVNAIRNVRGWWSEEIEGSIVKVGDEFKYHYQNLHTCTMKFVELVPGKRVAWLVTDNHFSFTEDKTEWKGTKVVFDIAKKGDKTEIHFKHEGLVPSYECYNVCSDAWGSYIRGSLKNLIKTGNGSPNPKESAEKV
jgi:plastocyanin